MEILAGTSGYSYKGWLGCFYPEKLPAQEMLRYYAERLPTVEINNTFYRMPAETLVKRWAEEVPRRFVFALKASRSITHIRRLKNVESAVAEFMRRASVLEEKLGVILFQLPPTLRKDLPRLRDFLGVLPPGRRIAIEFRHDSWHDPEVYEALRSKAVMLCVSETDDGGTPFEITSDCAYMRLRRTRYDERDLGSWLDRLSAHPLARAFVYFKHEDEALATQFARRLEKVWRARGSA
jgi:uncharacterized protein YecE (DUF72 family)